MNILIAAGGTGGHLYPGINLARELQKRGCEVLFAVRSNDLTAKILQREKLDYAEIPCAPVFGQKILGTLKGFAIIFPGVLRSFKVLGEFRPACVVGFGAYVSVPVVLASFLKGIPVVLHEQNSIPGWSNRLCSFFARKVAISFPSSQTYFSKKAVLIGNLIDPKMFSADRARSKSVLGLDPQKETVLIFGGSAGAKRLNLWILNSLQNLSHLKNQIQFLHLSGCREETEKLKKKYNICGFAAVVMDYSHEMDLCYAASDLAVCRAGAGSVSELIATQTPAILVPYPFATSGHQTINANLLKDLGSATVIEESENLDAKLSETTATLISQNEKLIKMRGSYSNFPINLKDSANKLADIVINLGHV